MTIGILLLIISVAELVLGFWFLTKYQKNQGTMWYGLFAIAVALYVGGNGYGYITDSIFVAERIGWIGGMLTATFILPFSYSFPVPKKTARELLPYVLWPVVIFGLGFLFTDLFVSDQGTISYRDGYETLAGPYFWFALSFFGIYWLWALGNVVRAMAISDGRHRWQLQMILLGVVLSLVVSTVFDIVLPLVTTSSFGYVGSVFSAIWLGFTSYILVRK